MKLNKYVYLLLCLGFPLYTNAQTTPETTEEIAFGNMDQWRVRTVNESFVIGGATKYLYEITSGDTLKDNTPYKPTVSPWATSTVMAKVSGIYKASITVFPEKRENGYCARLETRMEHVKVLGLINISVLATGTIFLGEIIEPVRDTKNPQSKLNNNIPFTRHPQALQFDYKVSPGGEQIKATGFSRIQHIPEQNNAEACLLLQYRWEDQEGNIFAKRVGTAYERYDQEVSEWQNNHRITVHYGDITEKDFFQPYMGLIKGESTPHCLNSKGKMVPIQEVGWADQETAPTHIVLRFSSGHGGAYIGAPDAKFWIDNVKLVY
ncbi:MAG: PCMD domain-containing protein [Odoribacter sp.]|nr:PCMD domain-containing protein [Odoribacter sp.]